MNHKLSLLAVFTSSVFGLTACSSGGGGSGDSHSNAPAPAAQQNQPQVKPNAPKAEELKKPEAGQPKAEESKKLEAEMPKAEEPKQPEAPEVEAPKVEEPKKSDAWDAPITEAERQQIEDRVEPFYFKDTKYTWRQLTAFKSSPKTTASDPLKEGSQNNRAGAARNDNVAAYVQGEGRFGNYGKKSLSQDKYLKETNYDIDFLKSAEIKADDVQTYELKDKDDSKAGTFHFVNQKYSSYLMWKPEKATRLDRESLNAYVTVPTSMTAEGLKAKANATYKGHLLVNKDAQTDEVHKADLELNADFNAMTMKGKITNRDDELLSGQATHAEYSKSAGDYISFVTSKEEEDLDYGQVYMSQEDIDKRKPLLRTLDIDIPEVSIAQQNDSDVHFFQKRQKSGNGGLEYIDPTTHNKVQAGEISGILAGPNAEEVVGEIKMRNERASFGAREKSNP